MKIVKCGMFGLPGVSFGRDEIDDDLLSEMKEWVEQSGCGIHMTDRLFSFKNSGHLDFPVGSAQSLIENRDSLSPLGPWIGIAGR